MTVNTETLSQAQVGTLQAIARMGAGARVSTKTSETARTVSSASARSLAAKGMVDVVGGLVRLTDTALAFLDVRHADTTPLHDQPAYQRGVAGAVHDRETAVVELEATLQDLKPGDPGYEFARHQVARFRMLDNQEGTTP